MAEAPALESRFRISSIDLDEHLVLHHGADVEHERRIAIFDLLEENYFRPLASAGGPYRVKLSVEENRLVFDIDREDGDEPARIALSLTPLRRIVKDYFLVCESYYDAIRHATTQQIEAIDMGRRSLHNEGSELLKQRLADRIEVDLDTARRLFTLVCVLHLKA